MLAFNLLPFAVPRVPPAADLRSANSGALTAQAAFALSSSYVQTVHTLVETLLERCLVVIQAQAQMQRTRCTFDVPGVTPGFPCYDVRKVATYLKRCLRRLEFRVCTVTPCVPRYTGNVRLLISWNHAREYVRDLVAHPPAPHPVLPSHGASDARGAPNAPRVAAPKRNNHGRGRPSRHNRDARDPQTAVINLV